MALRPELRGLALCAGIGGLELGLQIAMPEYRTVCAVEGEAFAAAILVSKMEVGELAPFPIWSDVRTFDGRPWRGKVDIVTSGFPCQPFSVAGQRQGANDERFIWPSIARIICEVRPGFIFLENVPGLLAMPQEFGTILGDLAEAGYDAVWDCFSAAEVGASHKRERLFILAFPFGSRTGDFLRQIEGRHGTSCVRQTDREIGTVRADTAESAMADPESLRGRETERGQSGRERPEQNEPSVDNSPGTRQTSRKSGENRQIWIEARRSEFSGRCNGLANSSQVGYERSGRTRGGGLEFTDGLMPFPPGPGDTEAWERILAVRPDLAPAVESEVRQLADGNAGRVDMLRTLGNTVVPLVAATAFLSLLKE